MELLSKLGELQKRCGCLPNKDLQALSIESGISLGYILSVASFYSYLTLEPDESDHIENIYPCRKAGRLLTPPYPYTWRALENARFDQDYILTCVEQAGLLGRSGGGFPAAKKWEITKAVESDEKYVVCNADEGELFTGKDRVVLEKNPRSVIEGMAICAMVIGAKKGFIYLRAEYADLKGSIEAAIAEAPLNDFEIEVYMGHGAYVCGDETSLLNSLEGKRGETRLKPPYPGVAGYLGKPTVVNNVETFANVSYILEHGADKFRSVGSSDYPGTKLFTICGAVRNPGVYEYPAGTAVGELLEAAGGAVEPLQAVLIGGGSCKLGKPDFTDVIMTPKGCSARGLSFGTGSIRFIGAGENMIDFVLGLAEFFAAESCGTCTPCRVGLRRITELLKKFQAGTAWPEDAELLAELAEHVRANARCPLGQAAVTPILSLTERFPEVLSCQ